MKKILLLLAITMSFLSALNVQSASKKELMCIKGIGDKKANAVIKYRKSHKLKSADDLLAIKGFGKELVKNVKKDVKSLACGGKKSTASKSTKKASSKKSEKKSDKKKSSKKVETKKESKKSDKKKSDKKKSSKKKSDKKKS